ncbi:hypothetical protein ONS96_008370 [Cadophora gregata f. sp. sojae]|nr:hypothetical protein ONS96_008370 [Cadophora gregata f. sp. sojae]
MMDSRSTSTTEMSIEIRLSHGGSQNTMNLASVLNPLPTPPASETEEEWKEAETPLQESLRGSYSYYTAPRPMEIDGEVPTNTAWEHHERVVPTLPPMRLSPEQRQMQNLAHRPAEVLRMPQISRHLSESNIARRQSLPTSHSPHRRHDRRGFYPRLSIASTCKSPSPSVRSESSRDGEESKVGKKKKRKPSGPHNNKPYTQEQFQWLWYYSHDRDFNYAEMYRVWRIQFPDELRDPGQAFSSRLYRESLFPVLDANGEIMRERDGKPRFKPIRKRLRQFAEFKDYPYKFWEHSPEWALYWDWVSPEHKAMAQRLLDGRDLDHSQLRKEKYRRAIRLYSGEVPMKKGWFATPALHAAAVQRAKANNESTRFNTSPSPEQASDIKLETQQISYWGKEYGLDSNGRKYSL